MKYTTTELMACVIARELKNDDTLAFGLNAELFLAAGFLAQKLYAPKLKIRHGLNWKNAELNPAAWTSDAKSKEFKNFSYYEQHNKILKISDKKDPFCTVFFVSGMQIDKYGNTNLIGIKNNGKIIRGPGSIGTSSIAQMVKRYYIFSFEHSKRRFVEKCDYVSTIGYDIRKKYKIPGGPKLIITPLCVFDFEDGKIRLKSVHVNSSLKEIKQKTGFDFIVPKKIGYTKEPTIEELEFLRSLDEEGRLKEIEKIIK